ncbi:thioredoxin family protein [Desulfofustis glycolicus]|uniref:thioredoxin family protein n=1 Tax=Desulfofustis glycolicus TaxID=51195 RepID=UPI00137B530F|nr:thioredoxin family protein [Desulfofustis glycolicus]
MGLEDDLCREVVRLVAVAVVESEVPVVVETHTDFEQMIARGVYAPPAVFVDGVLKSVGRVPEQAELLDWLSACRVR